MTLPILMSVLFLIISVFMAVGADVIRRNPRELQNDIDALEAKLRGRKVLTPPHTDPFPPRPKPVTLPNLEELSTQIALIGLPRPPRRAVVAYDEYQAKAGLIEPEMVMKTHLPPLQPNWSEQRKIIEDNRERALNNITSGGTLVYNGQTIADYDKQVKLINDIYWKRRNQLDCTPIPNQPEEPEYTFVWHPVDI
jgi:hypothetical protein